MEKRYVAIKGILVLLTIRMKQQLQIPNFNLFFYLLIKFGAFQ